MCIEIKETDFNTISVNGKEVYKDSNNNWIAKKALSSEEMKSFQDYMKVHQKPDYLNNVILDVIREREQQEAKWGVQNHRPEEWLMILGEEVGEANKAALETHFGYRGADVYYSEYRKELIQVAAVAIAMVESLDRNKNACLHITK